MSLLTHISKKIVERYLVIFVPGECVDIYGKERRQEGQRQLKQNQRQSHETPPQIGLLDVGTTYKYNGDHSEDHKCLPLPGGLFSLFDL